MEVFIFPSYLSLEVAKRIGDKYNILIGAQNMCPEDEGQFTGEVSPEMLKEIGINMLMAGHSESRHIFKDTKCNKPWIQGIALCGRNSGR